MAKRMLIKLTPLEPYFFGDENTIRFDNKNRYYVSSMNTPSAMTIMGMLRYTLLEQAGYLKEDGYSREEQERNEKLIGKTSFAPGNATEYGVIKEVSPLFIMNGDDVYIRLPLNHKFSDGYKKEGNTETYTPIKISGSYETSHGKISLPSKGEFKSKFRVDDTMYMNVENGAVCEEMFSDFVKVTNSKAELTKNYMKKCFKILKKGFCFAFTAELDENTVLGNTVCYMGREKSAFSLSAEEITDFSIEDKVKSGILKGISGFSIALSDIVLSRAPEYRAYAMVNIKNLRYLSTASDNGKISIRRGNTLHSVIESGSVFYGEHDIEIYGNDRFGINKIITLGGK